MTIYTIPSLDKQTTQKIGKNDKKELKCQWMIMIPKINDIHLSIRVDCFRYCSMKCWGEKKIRMTS